jgi:cytochrome c556
MKHQKRSARSLLPSALLACLGAASMVGAEELPFDQIEPAIKYRQNVMEAMGGLMGISAGQLRDGLALGPKLPAVARSLQAMSADVAGLFPEGTDFGETDAKAAVWEKPEEFAQAADALRAPVDAFVAATEMGDRVAMLKAFKQVADACKGCHEDFRKPHDH